MCGILGTVNLPFDDSLLDLIRHRGPDGSGIKAKRVGLHLVTLGHRRLSIIDLSSSGAQPMSTPCGRYTITFNGEIYNYQDLKASLREKVFMGHSDTEVILHCLAQSGILAVQDFNGIFAFGLLDQEHGKLYLARDPFGIKPLYYRAAPGSFAFSSEIRTLRALADDPVDADAVTELLRLRYLPAPDTLFKNIRKVRPGHVLEVDLWSPQLPVREYPFAVRAPQDIAETRQQAVEHYGALVEQAVRRQLLADVEVGVLLSGGVDSALVARYAQAGAPYRMKAFTVGFNERDDADEIADAAENAQALGLEHHFVRIGFTDFVELMPRITAMVEEPLATTSVVPMFYLSQLAAQHVKVVLSGQGVDEAMGGYRRYQAERLRPFVPRMAASLSAQAARFLGIQDGTLLRGLDSVAETSDVSRFLAAYTVFSPHQIQNLTGRDETLAAGRISYFFKLLRCDQQKHAAVRMMSLDLRMSLADDLLLYTDKITMHHSIECRVPLLDLDLVRYVESLPCRYRLGLLRGKVLHKQFASRVLGRRIAHRRKKGFLSPTRRWFENAPVIREILLNPRSRFASQFDLRSVEKIIAEHGSGVNRERHLFLLFGLYYWLEDAFGARPALARPAGGAAGR